MRHRIDHRNRIASPDPCNTLHVEIHDNGDCIMALYKYYMFLEILWEFGQIMYKYIKGNPKICVHLKCTLLGLMQVNVSVGIIK